MSVIGEIKTLSDIIDFTDKYNVNNISYYKKVDDIVTIGCTIFTKYHNFVQQYVVSYNISDEYRSKFRFKPELMSTAIYGTPNLAWLIMKLNGIESPSRFKLYETIKLIPKENLDELYDNLISKNNSKLQANWNMYLGES